MSLVKLGPREVNAVFTTGIYCRAGCSGRPKPENHAPYQSAIAAQATGFRPCLLCRPDRRADVLIDGTTPDVVRQALMLIIDGFMDDNTTDVMGRRLGISSRHLTGCLRITSERHRRWSLSPGALTSLAGYWTRRI
jgi:AraC family transcriptional regulator of adaptative response / DNA-3-methyladenine glycosylase II